MFPLQSFKLFIAKNDLFKTDQKVLLAVSGGKDSVLMVHLFKLAGYNFGIAHCNFSLRGEESLRDETFVKLLAANLEVPFHNIRFDTKAYAKTHHLSTQMAARELRYNWFEEIRQAEQYNYIALAHHQNDAIETVLLNLIRGTGITGLHGILPKRDKLIRPLLFLSRPDIDTCIELNNVSFMEDSSNSSDYYARNKIRLNVVPQLKDINPNLEYTFAQNIQRFSDTEEVVQQLVNMHRQLLMKPTQAGQTIAIQKIKELHPQKFLLFELLKPYGFSEYVVADLIASLNRQSGTSFYSSSHRITINRDELLITTISTEEVPHSIQILESDQIIHFKNQTLEITTSNQAEFERNRLKAFVDSNLLIFPLLLRTWQQGDSFMPLGMNTFKKLSNFYIDEKVPLPEKQKIPILVNGNGDLIWIAGMRQDNRYKVSATTKKVVIFELKFT
jgi:tRNA(Ile)-lysidine synthase